VVSRVRNALKLPAMLPRLVGLAVPPAGGVPVAGAIVVSVIFFVLRVRVRLPDVAGRFTSLRQD
jgi:hypothetical protein